MKKVQVKQITFARVEGRNSDLFNKVFPTWQEVETAIKNAAITAPGDGGYDKCDFLLEYENGFIYEGKFDMVRDHHTDLQPLAEHVTGYMKFLSGEQKPAHWKDTQYEFYVRDSKEAAKEFLQKYQIGMVESDQGVS